MGRRIAASVSASAHLWHPIFVLISLLVPCVTATGKGPVGSYAINYQYILVSDSNFDALFVVDVLNGSGIVATIALHSADLNPPTDDATFGEGGDEHIYEGLQVLGRPDGGGFVRRVQVHIFHIAEGAEFGIY